MNMPPEFFGRVHGHRANCGICGRWFRHDGQQGTRINHQLRAAGWTWRHDTGWTCPCRHQCGNLDLDQDPEHQRLAKRPRNRRHQRYRKPTARVQNIIRRRNRQEID